MPPFAANKAMWPPSPEPLGVRSLRLRWPSIQGELDECVRVIGWMAKHGWNRCHLVGEQSTTSASSFYKALAGAAREHGIELQAGSESIARWITPSSASEAICLSDAGMRRQVARAVCGYARKHLGIEIVDLGHAGMEAFCHCEACLRGVHVEPTESPDSEVNALRRTVLQTAFAVTYVEFVNTVAAEVAQKLPALMLGAHVQGCNAAMAPQDCPHLSDNVVLTVSHEGRDHHLPLAGQPKSTVNLSILARDVTWQQKTPYIILEEPLNSNQLPTLATDIKLLRRLRFAGIEFGYARELAGSLETVASFLRG